MTKLGSLGSLAISAPIEISDSYTVASNTVGVKVTREFPSVSMQLRMFSMAKANQSSIKKQPEHHLHIQFPPNSPPKYFLRQQITVRYTAEATMNRKTAKERSHDLVWPKFGYKMTKTRQICQMNLGMSKYQ